MATSTPARRYDSSWPARCCVRYPDDCELVSNDPWLVWLAGFEAQLTPESDREVAIPQSMTLDEFTVLASSQNVCLRLARHRVRRCSTRRTAGGVVQLTTDRVRRLHHHLPRGPHRPSLRAMRFATWNVNSLKARLPRVEAWLAEVQPDVLCVQETKSTDAAFPLMTFQALGYDGVHYGTGRWNGVAILSRSGSTTWWSASTTVRPRTPSRGCSGPPVAVFASARCTCRTVARWVTNSTTTSCDGSSA